MSVRAATRVLFETGEVVGGKYRIVSLLGVGGVGRVYLARHIELDTEVAVKVLKPEMLDRPDIVQRFSREARATVRLQSERIARVVDVGSHEGAPYFVMEHMVGCNLLEYRQQANPDIATLCELFIQACEGLAEAHAHGVVHRDIKSENLFVVRDASGWRSLKVFDFGISKFSLTGRFSDIDLSSMRTEVMMGTPHYISPEQIRSSRDVDHRTDLWSLGAVMFEVLSGGILPFREEREVTTLVAEVLERPHRSLLDIAPNVPERLATIVDRCLEKDRELRYQTAAEIALDLLPLAPVRARASAERAVSTMQAAGLMAVNGDMESLRPMPVEHSGRLSSTPPPRHSTPLSGDALPAPSSGLRPSESKLLAAAFLGNPPLASIHQRGTPAPSAVRPTAAGPVRHYAEHAAPPLAAPPSVVAPAAFMARSMVVTPPPVVAPLAVATPLPLGANAKATKRNRWLLLLVALACVLGLALFFSRRPQSPERAAVAAQALLPTPTAALAASSMSASAHAPSVVPTPSGSASAKVVRPKVYWTAHPAAAPASAKAPAPKSTTDSPPPPQPNKLELRRER
ncbi:MAG: serine/threonine-protein kinase [Pseudomonadota bacterium]